VIVRNCQLAFSVKISDLNNCLEELSNCYSLFNRLSCEIIPLTELVWLRVSCTITGQNDWPAP
jgi:hypothetical protein